MAQSSDRDYHRLVNAIAPMWTDILAIDAGYVTEHTHFFEAGGHSLHAMLLVARIERELGQTLPLFALVDNPTLSSLARYLLASHTDPLTDQPRGRDASESQTDYLLRYHDTDRQETRRNKFEKYYATAMSSAAHAEFCQAVYGMNFGQHGMADVAQLALMLATLQPTADDVVLDVGCGYGLISRYVAEQTGARVVGIDVAPSAIRYARTLAEHDARLQFLLMDLERLDFPSATFSLILSIDTLYYAPSLRSTLLRFKEIGNARLRLGIVRTFPIRSFTRETWSPHLSELATVLRETFGEYQAIDLSRQENEHWRKKVEVLDSLRARFAEEGNEELFEFRYAEATYEASIDQLRYLFLSGARRT